MILVTGFEPFGGLEHNPSQALLDLLPSEVGGKPLRKAVLPVDAEALFARNMRLLDFMGPRPSSTWASRRTGPSSPWKGSR